MTLIKLNEFGNQYLLTYAVAGRKGFVRADLIKGLQALERISRILFREGLAYAQCLLEKGQFFNPEIDRLLEIIELWNIEGIRLKQFGNLYRFSGTNARAIFAIVQTFIEMLNELDL